MNLTLINPDYRMYGDPPLGLAYLAAYIREKSNKTNVRILDQLNDSEIIKKLKKEPSEIVGISAVSSNYYKAKILAKKIKKILPNITLILGGVHITTFPNSFKNSPFDLAVRGEGEVPTLRLIEIFKEDKKINIKKLSKIPGFLLRNKKKIINTGLSQQIANLDELPPPARDLLNMEYYLLPRFSSKEVDPVGSILTSRGCPFACKFCSSSSFWGRKIRFFSAKRVVDEIELLHKKYKYKKVYIYDDLFSINKERLREIIIGLKEKKILGRVEFTSHGRANCFNEEIAGLLKEMNVKKIIFGFETGSQRILTYLKGQGVQIEDGINSIVIARRYGLNPGGFFMIGSPTETKEDIEQTYNFIKNYCSDNFIVYQTIAFPGTEIWDYAIRNDLLTEDLYEKEQKEFIDINLDFLLSKDISKEEFIILFNKIQRLNINKKTNLFKKILRIKIRYIKPILSIEFFKKANNLKSAFFKRI